MITLQIRYLPHRHGLTENQVQAIAAVIWGAGQ